MRALSTLYSKWYRHVIYQFICFRTWQTHFRYNFHDFDTQGSSKMKLKVWFKVLTPYSLILILYKTSNLFVTFFIHLVSESCKYYTLCINLTALMHILHILSISHKIFFWKSHNIANLYKASNEDCNRIVVCQRDIQHLSSKYTFKRIYTHI